MKKRRFTIHNSQFTIKQPTYHRAWGSRIVVHRAFLLALCIVHCASCIVSAQIKFNLNNAIPVTKYGNPLPNAWTGGINYPQWHEVDLNQDSKKDLFMLDRSDNRITILMNDGSGSPSAFHFDTNSVKYAKMFPAMSGWAFLYDYDNDGLPDLFSVDASNNGIIAYKSSIVSGTWKFTIVANPILANYPPFLNIAVSSYLTPFFADQDGDGDMDIVGQQLNCVGTFAYYENQSMQLYGVPDSLSQFKFITNSWGHFALRGGDPFLNCTIIADQDSVNCRPAANPIPIQPPVAEKDDTYACISLINLDGDTLIDAIIGDSQAKNLLALYNSGTKADARMQLADQDTAFPKYDKPARLSFFNCPSYVDVDNDGKKDMIVGNREYEDRKGMLFYKNNATNPAPLLKYQNDSLFQWGMIDVGEGAAPVFFDVDNDGLLDMIIGGIHSTDTACSSNPYKSTLTLYRNTGTLTNPAFEFVTDNYGGLSALSYPLPSCPYHPTFGDLDGDGKNDMVVGRDDGKLMFFQNKALQVSDPDSFSFPPTISNMGIDVGNCAAPQLIDLDNDGKLDLVIGEGNGTLNYCHNTGTLTAPVFASIVDTFGRADVHYLNYTDGFSAPYIFNDKGTFKMLVSCMQGEVLLYDNVNVIPGDSFPPLDTILRKDYGNRYGFGISVGGGDINGDGDADMVLGLYGGGVQIYYGDFPASVNEVIRSKIFFDVYPNPASETLNLNIHYRRHDEKYSLSVFNSIGEVVYSQKVSWGNQIIDTKRFSNGIYLVQLRTGEQYASTRVVVSH